MPRLSSSDEGEVKDMVSAKANMSPRNRGPAVDRPNRIRSRYSKSPSIEDSFVAATRRSYERSNDYRGSKRYRDDDHYVNDRDSRRSKVHYDDRRDGRYRGSRGYEDYDDAGNAPSRLSYDDGGRDYRARTRSRSRSRSPYRAPKDKDIRSTRDRTTQRNGRGRDALPDRSSNKSVNFVKGDDPSHQSVSNSGGKPVPTDVKNVEAKSVQGSSEHNQSSVNGTNDQEPEPVVEQLDEAALIEQRRKRREAILNKHRTGSAPLIVQALQNTDRSTPATPMRSETEKETTPSASNDTPDLTAPSTPKEIQDPTAIAAMTEQELSNGKVEKTVEDDGPSAADYDPTNDMKEDRYRDDKRHHHEEVPSSAYDEIKMTVEQDVLLPPAKSPLPAPEQKKPEKEEDDDFDMFGGDDDDDMFAEDKPETAKKPVVDIDAPAVAVNIPQGAVINTGMLDNWDDPEGYYKVILGELLNGRYHVQANLGKGMFSGVVRATDITTKKLVAIKLIRANETMKKAGMKEIEILQKLMEADPDDKKHMIRLERYFEHKGHLCMVFEHLSINLREVLKKFGRDVGINLRAVRVYAQQMFLGLSLMRKCNILHADLKPDNILVNDSRSMLKICDLGSASDATENEITPYLVSRFYRAPEIILGMPYDFAIDVWSVGCTLYELYTGKILFTGRSNNQMLRSIMETRGKFTTKMLKKSQFAYMHFDEQANFLSVEQDKLTGRDTVKTIAFSKPTRDLRTRLLGGTKGKLSEEETKELGLFVDLLEKCLSVNPEKRITPAEALKHPFIMRGFVPAQAR